MLLGDAVQQRRDFTGRSLRGELNLSARAGGIRRRFVEARFKDVQQCDVDAKRTRSFADDRALHEFGIDRSADRFDGSAHAALAGGSILARGELAGASRGLLRRDAEPAHEKKRHSGDDAVADRDWVPVVVVVDAVRIAGGRIGDEREHDEPPREA